nr:unnamed protein product [Naegleria fowleri]
MPEGYQPIEKANIEIIFKIIGRKKTDNSCPSITQSPVVTELTSSMCKTELTSSMCKTELENGIENSHQYFDTMDQEGFVIRLAQTILKRTTKFEFGGKEFSIKDATIENCEKNHIEQFILTNNEKNALREDCKKGWGFEQQDSAVSNVSRSI